MANIILTLGVPMSRIVRMEMSSKLKERYLWTKHHSAPREDNSFALEIIATDRPGLMADISSAVANAGGNLGFVQGWTEYDGLSHTQIQVDAGGPEPAALTASLAALAGVLSVHERPSFSRTYGKRIIIIGGGAQVAQVASGAIAEADRHNMRGETISVDTIAIVGEDQIAQAVRAVGRLHRASLVVLAGALMGGRITKAVQDLQETYGIPVMSLKMAGSVPKAASIVVTDPIAAGVMAVMLVSNVGKFSLDRVYKHEY